MSTHHRAPRIAALLALLAGAFVSSTRAQIWQGPASLEIRAEGRKGASVAGGTVELVYLALEPPAGPPPVPLDSNGRAVVNGLAEGMWRVSVSREGFMTYQAEVDVRRDEKPELVATFQQNVPGAVHMMKVRIARAKPSGPAPLPPPPQIAERPAPRPAEPPADRPAEPPAAAAPRVAEAPRPQAAPQQPEPEPEPEARPRPAPPVAAPQPTAPTQPAPRPAPSSPATPPAAPLAAQPAPAQPTPSPSPDPPAEPAPAPRPAPQQPAPSQPAPSQPAAPRPAPPPQPAPQATPSQPAAPPQAAPRPAPQPQPVSPPPTPPPPSAPPVAPEAAPPQPAPPAPAAPGGSVLHRSYADRTCYECKPGEASLSVERVVSAGAGCGAAVRDLLAQSGDAAGLPEGCGLLRLTLPPGSRYTGYRYEIQERSGSVDCLAGRDCPGGGRWPADPALARSAAGTTVTAAFENPGSGGDRRAVLTIYYTGGGR